MELTSKRGFFTETSTGSILYVNNIPFGYILEDFTRSGEKIKDRTAIPFGSYEIRLEHSPRYGRKMPLLIDVADFSGILIHYGNTNIDTSGCLLVGESLSIKNNELFLANSRITFDKLMGEFRSLSNNEKIWIHIIKSEMLLK